MFKSLEKSLILKKYSKKKKKLTGLAGVLGHEGEPISKSSCGCAPGDALGGAKYGSFFRDLGVEH